jgi:hypothetical protein
LSHNIYDSSQGVLVEANEMGEVTRSGFAEIPQMSGRGYDDVLVYYDEPRIAEETCQAFFQGLNPVELFAESPGGPDMEVVASLASNPYPKHSPVSSDELGKALANLTGDPGDNLINVVDLIDVTPLRVAGVSLYFAAAG